MSLFATAPPNRWSRPAGQPSVKPASGPSLGLVCALLGLPLGGCASQGLPQSNEARGQVSPMSLSVRIDTNVQNRPQPKAQDGQRAEPMATDDAGRIHDNASEVSITVDNSQQGDTSAAQEQTQEGGTSGPAEVVPEGTLDLDATPGG